MNLAIRDLVNSKSLTWHSEAKITYNFKPCFTTTDVFFSTIMNQSIDWINNRQNISKFILIPQEKLKIFS